MSTARAFRPVVWARDGKILVRCPYEDRDRAKQIEGRRWNPKEKAWEAPLSDRTLQQIQILFPTARIGMDVFQAMMAVQQSRTEVLGWKMDGDVEIDVPSKTPPMRHQRLAFAIATRIPAVGLWMEQGLGKSKVAVDTTAWRFLHSGLRRVLVVAPSSVVPVWPREYEKHCTVPFEVRELLGPLKKRIAMLAAWGPDPDRLQVAAINYDGMREMADELIQWLRGVKVSAAIADESQRIKNPTAKQSKEMARIGAAVQYRLALSGTPVTQGPLDFFGQYRFLDPTIFGTSFTRFRARYAEMGGYSGREVVGYRHLDELIQKAHSIAFRATKAEALDLPEEVDQTLYVDLGPSSARVYRDLVSESIALLSQEQVIVAQNVLTRLLRLQQVTGGFVTAEDGRVIQVGDEKLRLLDELLEDLLSGGEKKVVIFARFLPEIDAIRRLLEKRGIDYRHIDGSVSQEDRGRYVDEFQADPDIRVFVAQIQTAGLGITLTAADTAIFYSMDFSMANHEQARARISRIGQEKKMTYIYLLARDTVDERVFATLQAKKNVADLVVDRWREFFDEKG